MMKYSEIDFLVCPGTKKKLTVDTEKGVARTADGNIRYPIADDIIDFCMEDNDHISKSYDRVSGNYDSILTNSTPISRLYNNIVWGLGDSDYLDRLLPLFPPAKNKIILDIPVGTGVFTTDLYKRIENDSSIIVMDYSIGMLKKARERYRSNGLNNIVYIHGNINNIPLMDGTIDILLTMNGYHAFPDKNRALSEMARIIKPEGSLLGCFYIKGERRLTDFFINLIYKRAGAFTPPFFSMEDVKRDWSRYFSFKLIDNYKSITYFSANRKKSTE